MGQQGEEEEEACYSAAPAGENPLQTDALPLLQHDQAAALNLPAQGFFFYFLLVLSPLCLFSSERGSTPDLHKHILLFYPESFYVLLRSHKGVRATPDS